MGEKEIKKTKTTTKTTKRPTYKKSKDVEKAEKKLNKWEKNAPKEYKCERVNLTKSADFFIIYLRIIKIAYKKRAGFCACSFLNADIKT